VLAIDGVDAPAGFLGKRRVWILGKHVVVINLRALPLVPTLIVASNLVAAPGLLALQGVYFVLRFGDSLVRGVQGAEISESGDGLGGDALIVLRLFRLLEVGVPDFVECIGAFLPVGVFVGSTFVGAGGLRKIADELSLISGADVDLRLRSDFAVGPVLDDLLVELDGLVHRGKKRQITERAKPLPGQVAVGDGHLAKDDFIVIGNLRVAFDQFLVSLEGGLILLFGFVTSAEEILRLRSVVGERPHAHRPARGFNRSGVILGLERVLGHFHLVFGARADPGTGFTNLLVTPAFARREDQWSRTACRKSEQSQANQHRKSAPTVHGSDRSDARSARQGSGGGVNEWGEFSDAENEGPKGQLPNPPASQHGGETLNSLWTGARSSRDELKVGQLLEILPLQQCERVAAFLGMREQQLRQCG